MAPVLNMKYYVLMPVPAKVNRRGRSQKLCGWEEKSEEKHMLAACLRSI